MEIKIHLLTNLWGVAEVVLKTKFISLNTYVRKEEKSKSSNLPFTLGNQEKE